MMISWVGRPEDSLTLLSLSAHWVWGAKKDRRDCDTEIVLPFPLVSEPTASDRKNGSAAAAR